MVSNTKPENEEDLALLAREDRLADEVLVAYYSDHIAKYRYQKLGACAFLEFITPLGGLKSTTKAVCDAWRVGQPKGYSAGMTGLLNLGMRIGYVNAESLKPSKKARTSPNAASAVQGRESASTRSNAHAGAKGWRRHKSGTWFFKYVPGKEWQPLSLEHDIYPDAQGRGLMATEWDALRKCFPLRDHDGELFDVNGERFGLSPETLDGVLRSREERRALWQQLPGDRRTHTGEPFTRKRRLLFIARHAVRRVIGRRRDLRDMVSGERFVASRRDAA